jgi:hypothetical protein
MSPSCDGSVVVNRRELWFEQVEGGFAVFSLGIKSSIVSISSPSSPPCFAWRSRPADRFVASFV